MPLSEIVRKGLLPTLSQIVTNMRKKPYKHEMLTNITLNIVKKSASRIYSSVTRNHPIVPKDTHIALS